MKPTRICSEVRIGGELYWPCRFRANPEKLPTVTQIFLQRDGILSSEWKPFTGSGNSRTSRDFHLVCGSVNAEVTVYIRVDLMPRIIDTVLSYGYGRLRYKGQQKQNAFGAHFVPRKAARLAHPAQV